MPGVDIASLEAELSKAYSALRPLYQDADKNALSIADLMAKILALSSAVNQEKLAAGKASGDEYHEKEGVFLNKQETKERDWAVALYEKLRQPPKQTAIPPADTLSTPTTPPPPQQTPGQQTPSPAKRKPNISDYRKWENPWLQRPLKDNQWYNNHQVEMLTGRKVPVGNKELSSFLKESKHNAPLAFSYLMTPEPKNPSLNHFVSMYVNAAGTEITYLDSNGEKIRPEDEKRLKEQFPNAQIVYRDHEGQKIPKEIADRPPEKPLLRVQFDGHNCGMYSAEFATLMKEAHGDESKIQEGIKKIKAIDPTEKRMQHEAHLHARKPYSVGVERTQGIKAKL